MLFNCILLALSVSIDSLTIGISYGIKKQKSTILVILFFLLYHFALLVVLYF